MCLNQRVGWRPWTHAQTGVFTGLQVVSDDCKQVHVFSRLCFMNVCRRSLMLCADRLGGNSSTFLLRADWLLRLVHDWLGGGGRGGGSGGHNGAKVERRVGEKLEAGWCSEME